MSDAYIFDHVRTPRGKGKKDGSLHQASPVWLLSTLLRALQQRSDLDTGLVDDVVLGCVTPVGEQGACIARVAALAAGYDQRVSGVGAMERALDETLRYAKERKAFGKTLWDFQNTRFKLAEVQATVLATRAFVDACMVAHLKGELDAARAALAKAWVSEQQCKVMDECLQLFGGYGYMMEYPIAELYVDARVQRIYGGTNEIMKELASRFM